MNIKKSCKDIYKILIIYCIAKSLPYFRLMKMTLSWFYFKQEKNLKGQDTLGWAGPWQIKESLYGQLLSVLKEAWRGEEETHKQFSGTTTGLWRAFYQE